MSRGSAGLPVPTNTRTDEQLTLIDEPGIESVRGEVRASYGEISGRGCFQVTDRVRVEVALELRLGGRDLMQGRGKDDLVRSLPEVGEVAHEFRLRGHGGVGLPHGHRLVHAAAVEVGADGADEISDEREDLVVGRRSSRNCRASLRCSRPGRRSRCRSAWTCRYTCSPKIILGSTTSSGAHMERRIRDVGVDGPFHHYRDWALGHAQSCTRE